ncbi:hypothetical protein SAMN05421630_10458 [Prauserella marina]|uniref:Uncharacterized protein n=1 Tax=Prauserella marina TaxID=530584 RepID=A0A1G6PU63_9PSEU|nr:hypothetical protein [Prauserella marina]PWV78328.1 hypothetical protein DES30_10458 [Prauserella marina]SDC83521.1 hypothetical protein SAMN05421630_10458 [Prauserella marina]
MGEQSERTQSGEEAPAQATTPAPIPQSPAVSTYRNPEPEPEQSRKGADWRAVKDQVVGLLAGIVRWVGLIFALILVLHVIFVIGEANQDNGIVSFVSDWSRSLSLGFHDLFQPEDPKLSVLVNFGIAALFWLVVSSIVARLIRRVGGAN